MPDLQYPPELQAVLAGDDYDADFAPPTTEVSRLYAEVAPPLPPQDLGPVGDGGLIAQWGPTPAPYVRLLIPCDVSAAYIFSRAVGVKRISPATKDDLARELAWLESMGVDSANRLPDLPREVDYQEGWVNGEWELVEVP